MLATRLRSGGQPFGPAIDARAELNARDPGSVDEMGRPVPAGAILKGPYTTGSFTEHRQPASAATRGGTLMPAGRGNP